LLFVFQRRGAMLGSIRLTKSHHRLLARAQCQAAPLKNKKHDPGGRLGYKEATPYGV
jgi:hypothetical protein